MTMTATLPNPPLRLIDLSMEVYQGMMTYPNVAKPVIVEMETHRDMARSIGVDQYGVDEITNHCMIVTGDHIGTHIDSWGHVKPDAPRAEGIPIESLLRGRRRARPDGKTAR